MAGRLVMLVLSAWLVHYFSEINADRRFHDIEFHPTGAVRPETEALRFMRFQPPPLLKPYSVKDLDAVIAFLQSQPSSFFLLGDSSILYGLSGKPSVNPQLFFHSLMRPDSFTEARRDRYEGKLLESSKRYDVGFVVLEGEKTWTEVGLHALPRLKRLVSERSERVHSFGVFQVVELR
jgi:hypothetical protein